VSILIVLGLAGLNANADVQVIPAIAIQEIFDSNVFFAPKEFLPSGVQAEDLITTVVPQLMVRHSTNLVSTNISAGLMGQKFLSNSEFDNIGYNGSAGIDFSRLATRYLPRMRTLQVFGTMLYSPSTNAFGVGGLGAGIGGGGVGIVGVAGPADSGQMTQRIRTSMYTGGIVGSYALSPGADFMVSYTYSQFSFGGTFSQPTADQSLATAFDTVAHTMTMGPRAQVSSADTIGFNYMFSQFNQQNFGSFSTHGGQFVWSRTWSAQLASTLSGGLTLVESFTDMQSVGGGRTRIPATIFPTGNASITYKSGSSFLQKLGSELKQSLPGYGSAAGGITPGMGGMGFMPMVPGMIMPGAIASSGSYALSLNYMMSIYPSYIVQAGPIFSHIIALSGSLGLTDRLSASSTLNFAHSEQTSTTDPSAGGGGGNGTFDSYGYTVMANYLLAPSLNLTFAYNWLRFAGGSSGGTEDFGVSKHMLMLGLTYAFTPRGDFFRSGAFWQAPSSTGAESGAVPAGIPGGVDKTK
jgi:hypothetical protein